MLIICMTAGGAAAGLIANQICGVLHCPQLLRQAIHADSLGGGLDSPPRHLAAGTLLAHGRQQGNGCTAATARSAAHVASLGAGGAAGVVAIAPPRAVAGLEAGALAARAGLRSAVHIVLCAEKGHARVREG